MLNFGSLSSIVTLLDAEHNQLDQRMLWMSTFADQYASKYVVKFSHFVRTHNNNNNNNSKTR